MRHRSPHRAVAAACLSLGLAATAAGAEPDRPARADHVPEFLEMAWMIVTKGADMGPTDGWFHPAQGRYGWDWLKARDRDGDGSISEGELGGPAESFRRLDRDRDGMITADDLDWSPRSAYLRRQAEARRRFVRMDTDTNGKVSREEWDAFFARAAGDKGALSPEDLSVALDPPPPAPTGDKRATTRAPAADEPSKLTLLVGLFRGELGSRFEGPGVGDLAPDFTLATHDGKDVITLSQFRGKKPVVLIFGSFT